MWLAWGGVMADNSWRLTRDSLVVADGTTYRYSVDTPKGEGLVSTRPDVADVLNGLPDGKWRFVDAGGAEKNGGLPEKDDRLQRLDAKGRVAGTYPVALHKIALAPDIKIHNPGITTGVSTDLVIDFFAGQRTPGADVEIIVPAEFDVTPDNVTVDVIGRGPVVLRNLSKQSIGRTGTNYSYSKVGEGSVTTGNVGGKPCKIIKLAGIDLRPDNGPDVRMVLKGVKVSRPGDYPVAARYTVSQPEALASEITEATVMATPVIADLHREAATRGGYRDNQDFSWTALSWTPTGDTAGMQLMVSDDRGATWNTHRADIEDGRVVAGRLEPDKLYAFKLRTLRGPRKGDSNVVWYHSGKINVKDHGVAGDGTTDDTDAINKTIDFAASIGGGTLVFPTGEYPVRTVHLKSNVWLLVDSGAVIKALPGGDTPELTWFSDRDYRSGLSPTDPRPYNDPENYMTKQDVGHTYFRNTMFHGERIENVKIVGRGRITGNGNIVTGDKVMNNAPERRCDKMFTFKLCRNIEIGGPETDRDMWYDETADEPYYIDGDRKAFDRDSMLHIDQGGHFVLLATGTDGIYVHDTYFGNYNTSNARDIYDFMACNDVHVRNIYSKVSSDDIVKPGSDCSLGFTRPARGYMVRNIVGDTNCNLFQIGSETADDIQDLYVDNIYVLGANKAGFSISANDGAHVKNVYLNSGKTGPLHHRSVMKRTRAPFFISISNRGRVLGADVEMFAFTENGAQRKELLVTNSNIGRVENIHINGVDIDEVYGGSSFRKKDRWTPYDGSQNEATPIIAGFKLPDSENVVGGLSFTMPDGRHTGYIDNVSFNDVNILVKGGHPAGDAEAFPPEIGVGRYNVGDLKIQPAYGFWFRHAKNVKMNGCTVGAEREDGRYPVVLDDVIGAEIVNLNVKEGVTDKEPVKILRSEDIHIR